MAVVAYATAPFITRVGWVSNADYLCDECCFEVSKTSDFRGGCYRGGTDKHIYLLYNTHRGTLKEMA